MEVYALNLAEILCAMVGDTQDNPILSEEKCRGMREKDYERGGTVSTSSALGSLGMVTNHQDTGHAEQR